MYSVKKEYGAEDKKAKGINETVIKIAMSHEGHKSILFEKQQKRYKMERIKSKSPQLGTLEVNKISLSFLMISDI